MGEDCLSQVLYRQKTQCCSPCGIRSFVCSVGPVSEPGEFVSGEPRVDARMRLTTFDERLDLPGRRRRPPKSMSSRSRSWRCNRRWRWHRCLPARGHEAGRAKRLGGRGAGEGFGGGEDDDVGTVDEEADGARFGGHNFGAVSNHCFWFGTVHVCQSPAVGALWSRSIRAWTNKRIGLAPRRRERLPGEDP